MKATHNIVPSDSVHHFYMIEITGFCSQICPICYASATPDPSLHKPVNDVVALGTKIRAVGGRYVQLIGGEPTEHPDLIKIILGLRKLGLRILLATNGLRLGSDPMFAASLKKAGLYKANIQFDTLTPETSVIMRGADLIEQKKAALHNCCKAGLNVGTISVICDLNIHETGALLRFASSFTPFLNTAVFKEMYSSGRTASNLSHVGCAEIFDSMLSKENNFNISSKDIMPPVQYPPLGGITHPACGSYLFICHDKDSRELRSLNRDVDLNQMFSTLAASRRQEKGLINSAIFPFFQLMKHAVPESRHMLLRRLVNMGLKRGKHHLFTVYVDSMMDKQHYDPERARRCPTCFVTENGFETPCVKYAE